MKLKKQKALKDLLNQDQGSLYTIIKDVVPKNVMSRKNKARAWLPWV